MRATASLHECNKCNARRRTPWDARETALLRRRWVVLHHAEGIALGILAVREIPHAGNGHPWRYHCAAVGLHGGDHVIQRRHVDRIDHRWHAWVAPHDRAIDAGRVLRASGGEPV